MRFWSLGVLLLVVSARVFAHGHAHGESNPAHKYSREANERPIVEDEIIDDDIVDLPPSHAQGHSHEGHGHSHGGHGHSHEGHGHSHGGHSRVSEPSPEERKKRRERLHKIWDDDEEEEPVGGRVWLNAIGATLLISAAPFFILFLIPLDNSAEKRWLMKIFLSFASGGLLGDAFLHLIPHAMMSSSGPEHQSHSHSHSHSHSGIDGGHEPHDLTVGLGVLSGIIAFLCVEKIVRVISGGGGHGHSHDSNLPAEKKVEKSSEAGRARRLRAGDDDGDRNEATNENRKDDPPVTDGEKKCEEETTSKRKESKDTTKSINNAPGEESGEIKVTGFLNLFADCFHNFTDGLAIGASFSAGESVGVVTTLTILLHEVPHEIGDYAILIQSGVPPQKAIMLQLLTAVGALTGCVVSLLAHGGDISGPSTFILPFTAGGFIYIATVSVMPDILEGKSTFKQSVLEISALLAGVAMMILIAQYE